MHYYYSPTSALPKRHPFPLINRPPLLGLAHGRRHPLTYRAPGPSLAHRDAPVSRRVGIFERISSHQLEQKKTIMPAVSNAASSMHKFAKNISHAYRSPSARYPKEPTALLASLFCYHDCTPTTYLPWNNTSMCCLALSFFLPSISMS
ncbi:hypothetical protein ACJQWK_07012 [Exserohilum turcicum]